MNHSVIRCFLDSDLRCGHEGLAETAKKSKVDVSKLSDGEYVVFVNARADRVKIYAARNTIAYLKSPTGKRIDLRIIQEIPRAFNGGVINYDKALKDMLEKRLSPVEKVD